MRKLSIILCCFFLAAALTSAMAADQSIMKSADTRVNNSSDLAAALKRSDNETVQLPSGRLATVGQIKRLQPMVEKQLGRKLTSNPQRPNLEGPAIKISKNISKEEWKGIFQKPDNTVLESPSGKRITLGELKKTLSAKNKKRVKSAPTLQGGEQQ